MGCEIIIHLPGGIYLLEVNYGNIRTIGEICSKLTIKTLEQNQWRRPGVFIVNFEQLSHIVLVFPWLTLRKQMPGEFTSFRKFHYIQR